jgi:hypothetical protein
LTYVPLVAFALTSQKLINGSNSLYGTHKPLDVRIEAAEQLLQQVTDRAHQKANVADQLKLFNHIINAMACDDVEIENLSTQIALTMTTQDLRLIKSISTILLDSRPTNKLRQKLFLLLRDVAEVDDVTGVQVYISPILTCIFPALRKPPAELQLAALEALHSTIPLANANFESVSANNRSSNVSIGTRLSTYFDKATQTCQQQR